MVTKIFSNMSSSGSFIISGFTFRSMIPGKLIFGKSVRSELKFFFFFLMWIFNCSSILNEFLSDLESVDLWGHTLNCTLNMQVKKRGNSF